MIGPHPGKVLGMAKTKQKDILTKLADVGEEAFSRVAGSTTTSRVLESVNGMRERVDELQRKMRGLDALEKRVADLEQAVADLSKPKTRAQTSASKPTARKRSPSSSSSRSATRKPPPS